MYRLNVKIIPKTNLVTEGGPNPHALVRAQVVIDVAGENIRNFVNGTARLCVFISAARVPIILLDDVDFTGNVTETESSTGDDRNGVRMVVDAPEVAHLDIPD